MERQVDQLVLRAEVSDAASLQLGLLRLGEQRVGLQRLAVARERSEVQLHQPGRALELEVMRVLSAMPCLLRRAA